MVKLGKRALHKARTRLDILNAVYELSRETNFRSLKVKSIASRAQVTEMTFFNYFQKKEDILRYMMGIWTLDLMALQLNEPLTGEAAIRRVFSHTAAQVEKHPELFVNFISYLATSEIDPIANDIDVADRALRYPDSPGLHAAAIPSGNDLLLQHLNEIDSDVDRMETLIHLASCFYGDVIVAHTAGLDLNSIYSSSLDLIFSSMR